MWLRGLAPLEKSAALVFVNNYNTTRSSSVNSRGFRSRSILLSVRSGQPGRISRAHYFSPPILWFTFHATGPIRKLLDQSLLKDIDNCMEPTAYLVYFKTHKQSQINVLKRHYTTILKQRSNFKSSQMSSLVFVKDSVPSNRTSRRTIDAVSSIEVFLQVATVTQTRIPHSELSTLQLGLLIRYINNNWYQDLTSPTFSKVVIR